MFFALRGETFNGNQFAGPALESGAACVVVDDPQYVLNQSCILVDDVLTTLQALAKHHRTEFTIPVIAITGTNGKTTTKELINRVLSTRYKTLATQGNLNNHIGVPLTLLNIDNDTEVAIIEMGANHPGEIDFLCKIAQPGFGLITNIGRAHLDGFGSYEGVIRTKTELYRFLGKHDGAVFINTDDSVLKEHSPGIRAITYGHAPADVAVNNITADPFVCMDMLLRDEVALRIESNIYGGYNSGNILAAACIGQYFNISPANIKSAIEGYRPENNRSQITKTDRNLLVLDAYNANPSSMKAALETFAGASYTEKTLILGDMLELGKETDPEHLAVLELIEQLCFEHVYLVGPVFTRLNSKRKNHCFQDSDLARMWLDHHKIENATVLVKGSRGIHLEKLLAVL